MAEPTDNPNPSDPHPDAALIDAWARWRAGWRASKMLPGGAPQEAYDALEAPAHRAEDVIRATPARTAVGLAVRLRLLLATGRADLAAEDAIVFGLGPAGYLAADESGRLAWAILQDAERLAGEA